MPSIGIGFVAVAKIICMLWPLTKKPAIDTFILTVGAEIYAPILPHSQSALYLPLKNPHPSLGFSAGAFGRKVVSLGDEVLQAADVGALGAELYLLLSILH